MLFPLYFHAISATAGYDWRGRAGMEYCKYMAEFSPHGQVSSPGRVSSFGHFSGDFVSPMVSCNWLYFQYVLSFARRKNAFSGPLFSRSSQLR